MKKVILTLVGFMLVLGMTQCKKEQQPNNTTADDGETVYITMKVADDGGKHIVYPGTGAVVYSDGDVIYVGNNGKYVGSLTYANGAFSGSLTNPSTSDYLYFYFTGGKTPATAPTVGSTTSFTVDISDQSSKLPVLSYGHSTTKYIDGTTAYTCMLENKCGLVKFVPSTPTFHRIIVDGMKTTATIDFANGTIAPTDATGAVTLYPASTPDQWAILLQQDEVTNPTVTTCGYTATITNVPAVTNNMFYSMGVAISMTDATTPTGATNGLFTINSSGDQVWFSQGNLNYSNYYTNKLRFFESPTFMVLDWQNNIDYSSHYTSTGSFEHFGWGTSGYNHGAVCYQPWSTSTTNSDYYAYGEAGLNLYDGNGQADWGYNAIGNGDNQEGLWRTPTYSDWQYMIYNRSTPSGIRYAKAMFYNSNLKGLILLPDDWSTSVYPLKNTNYPFATFNSNVITSEEWLAMKDAGAVFLPATGYRDGNMINDCYTVGAYWTASYDNDDRAFHFEFSSSNVALNNRYQRHCGLSVRLVRDAD